MAVDYWVYVGDAGDTLELTVQDATHVLPAALSSASKKVFKVLKPGATAEVEWTATVKDANTLAYTTIVGDLSVAGTYKIHAYVEWTDASPHHGKVFLWKIYDKWKA